MSDKLFSITAAEESLGRSNAPFVPYEDKAGGYITFPNSWSVSIRWGAGNYCANRTEAAPLFAATSPDLVFVGETPPDCPDAEVAVQHDDGPMKVLGWQTWDEVEEVLKEVEARPVTELDELPVDIARQSFSKIDDATYDARQEIEVTGATIVVDGTMYSPSTRACPYAEHVYQDGTDDEWEEFQAELDELVEAYAHGGYHLSWEDGSLWLCGPQWEPED